MLGNLHIKLAAAAVAVGLALGVVSPAAGLMTTAADRPLGTRIYLDPTSQLVTSALLDSRLKVLATTPTARWLTEGSASSAGLASVRAYLTAASLAGAAPELVLYNMPGRDCGAGYSSGGLPVHAYLPWIRHIANLLQGRKNAIVILEPDAIAQSTTCTLSYHRFTMLSRAASRLASTGARVYIDAGNATWLPAETAGRLLAKAGVRHATGFSLNVSSFVPTGQTITYAKTIARYLANHGAPHAHYVIDTSRNGGNVTPGDWCNPVGARIGKDKPQLLHGSRLDAYLWVKPPGESDGTCNGGPSAGTFSLQLALRLLGKG